MLTLLAVHLHMAMRNELARGAARIRETKTKNDIVEPSLKQLEQRFARDSTLLQRRFEDAAKLLLHQPVLETKLLFLAERDCVIRLLAARTFGTMHPGRIILALE